MAFDFSRAVHEPYECTIAPAPVGDLFQSIPYYLPVRCSSLPPQDHSAYIDAAIAIRDGLEEVDAMFFVYLIHPNRCGGFDLEEAVLILIRVAMANSADPMVHC